MKNPRARIAQLVIGGVALLTTAGLIGYGTITHLSTVNAPPPGASADLPLDGNDTYPWSHPDQVSSANLYATAWKDMNTALQKKDRALFLSHAEGKAAQQLALWWDNMDAIGFTTGYVAPSGTTTSSQVSIGVDLGFPANALRGSDSVDAGLVLPVGQQYHVVTQQRGKDIVITSFTPAGAPMPWDDGQLYVVKKKHAIVYGLQDERTLVDTTSEMAEKAASTLLDFATKLGSKVPQRGFLSAVTNREDRLKRWHDSTQGLTEIAGFARVALQPSSPLPIMDPTIASGGRVGGSTVVLGPGAISQGPDGYARVFIHEFTHCLQNSAAPSGSLTATSAPFEGFARFVEWQTGFGKFTVTAQLKANVASLGAEAFSDAQVDNNATATTGYLAAGSFYRFVAENGGDPWALAVRSSTSFLTLDKVAQAQNPKFTVAAWQAWIAAL